MDVIISEEKYNQFLEFEKCIKEKSFIWIVHGTYETFICGEKADKFIANQISGLRKSVEDYKKEIEKLKNRSLIQRIFNQ